MNQETRVTQALQTAFPGHTFAKLSISRIGEAFGFASQIYRARWEHNGRKESVVVKIWPFKGESSLAELKFFQAEHDLQVRIPKYVYGTADHERNQVVLLLEDVANAIQGDYLKLPTHSQTQALLTSLGRWHAHTVDHLLLKNEWVIDFSEWQPEEDWIKSRRAEFIERFPHQLNPQALNILNRLESAPAAARKLSHDAPTCLLHGDFHLDNILFESDDRPVFLDWSHPAKGSPAYNLVQLLVFMNPLQKLDQGVAIYLETFNRHASHPVTLETLKRWLNAEFLRAFATSTCGIARWRPTDERGQQIVEDTIEKINAAAAFWRPSFKNIGNL